MGRTISVKTEYLNDEKIVYSKLSTEARILLRRASFPGGTIMYGRTFSETFIQIDRTNLITNPKNPREVAKWESALSELVTFNLVADQSNDGQIFSITHLGYKVADEIKRK